MNKNQRGGKRSNAGRKPEPGFSKLVNLRFMSEDELQQIMALTNRERVQIILEWLEENS